MEALRRLEPLAERDHVRWSELVRIVLSWAQARRAREEREALRAAGLAALADANRRREVADMGQTIGEAIREEGRLKAEATGELRASRRILRQLLTKRFNSVPEAIVQRIESCTDLDRLMAAAGQVLTLDKPEDLQLEERLARCSNRGSSRLGTRADSCQRCVAGVSDITD